MTKKKPYGQTVFEHHAKGYTLDDDVIEYRRAMEPDVIATIQETATKAKNSPQYKNKDFYVVMLFKTERIGQALRNYVLARISCPTPTYKQAVWKYHQASDSLEFLWSIPEQLQYYHIIKNAPKFLEGKETRDLTRFVLLMESGELLQWVKKENGELKDAVIKISTEA